jgi:alpha-tubulin suppressor-like RCC1 family protein/endonuclease/exonuclease/phosphatase family metal-dependent hydrolase
MRRSVPTKLRGSHWRRISTSGATTCAIKTDGALWCWGLNNFGQVGARRSGPRLKPTQVGTATWSSVATGWGHTCGIRSPSSSDSSGPDSARPDSTGTVAGTLWCWGQNVSGQLGVGRTNRHIARPTRVGSASNWSTVTVGGWHTCATRADHSAWCWGRNTFGQLGRDTRSQSSPIRLGKRHNWAALSAGWGHTCATRTSTGMKCWGYNDQGQLGDGSRTSSAKPRLIGTERRWRSVTAGEASTCALDAVGQTWCWGGNRYRQLGAAVSSPALLAVRAEAAGSMTSLTSGWLHVCVAAEASVADSGPDTASGSDPIICWGNNEEGQLGNGAITRSGKTGPALRAGPLLADRVLDRMTLREVATHAVASRPAVSARLTTRALRTKSWRARLMTFNVLGSQHTAPGGSRPDYAPGRVRAEWSTTLMARKRASLIGMQEVQPDQLAAFESANPGRFGFYPGVSLGYGGVPQSVAWRRSTWSLVWHNTVSIPFVDTWRPQPLVRLRNRATGEELYWINVHFSPGGMERDRDRATRIVTTMVRQLQRDKLPILLTGDFNEHREIFCKVTRKTHLLAANGGSNRGRGRCRPPRRMRVDWIFASGGELRRLRIDQDAAVRRITDHAVLTTRFVGD